MSDVRSREGNGQSPGMSGSSFVAPRWDAPFPYGFPAAIDSMGSVAAPLLAGFAVTVATLILTNPDVPRWPNPTLALLLVAAFLLGASVQFTFRARLFAVTPADIEVWWPEPDEWQVRRMRQEQRYHRARYRVWSHRGRVAYNAGIVSFLVGITCTLIPHGQVSDGRLAVIALAALAAAAEAVWVMLSLLRKEPLLVLPDVVD